LNAWKRIPSGYLSIMEYSYASIVQEYTEDLESRYHSSGHLKWIISQMYKIGCSSMAVIISSRNFSNSTDFKMSLYKPDIIPRLANFIEIG